MFKENRVTNELLDTEINNGTVKYSHLDGSLTHCQITVPNGFIFTGESACVDPSNYDKKIGESIAFENAKEKMWGFYGFLLKQKLYEQKK